MHRILSKNKLDFDVGSAAKQPTEQPGSLSFPYRDAQRFFFLFLLLVQGCPGLPLFFSSTVFRGSLVPAWKINEKIQPVPTTITDISWKEKPKIRTWRRYGKNTVSGLSSRKVPAFFIRMRCPDGVQAQKSLSTCLAPALTKPTTFWTNLGPRAFPLKTHLQGKSPGDKVDLWASAEEKVAPE